MGDWSSILNKTFPNGKVVKKPDRTTLVYIPPAKRARGSQNKFEEKESHQQNSSSSSHSLNPNQNLVACIQNLVNFNPNRSDSSQLLLPSNLIQSQKGTQCVKCHRLILLENSKTSRRWERDYYCLICFEKAEEIQIEILKRKQLIMDYCIDSNQVKCDLCNILMIDVKTKNMMVKCEMDHKRIFDKLFSIGDYIFTNDPRISAEMALSPTPQYS